MMSNPDTCTSNLSQAFRFRTFLTEAMAAEGAKLDALDAARPNISRHFYDARYGEADRRYEILFNFIRDLDETIVAVDAKTGADREVQLRVACARIVDDDVESRALVQRVLTA
jgi:hypothetical protein